ncbi:MAG: EamA family transporter [Clostridiales bacterium]|nr:EamA family transporter [Clostridiales bacterium]
MSELAAGGIFLTGVFISSVSQVLLKRSALNKHDSGIKEYLNPLVIGAYILFFGATLLSILAYRVLPLSKGAVIDSFGYVFITFWGVTLFRERLNPKRIIALILIISGIIVYSVF